MGPRNSSPGKPGIRGFLSSDADPHGVSHCPAGETETQRQTGTHCTEGAGSEKARVRSGFNSYHTGKTIRLLGLCFRICKVGILRPASKSRVSLNCERAGTKVPQVMGGSTEPEGASLIPVWSLRHLAASCCYLSGSVDMGLAQGSSHSWGCTLILPAGLQRYRLPSTEVKGDLFAYKEQHWLQRGSCASRAS